MEKTKSSFKDICLYVVTGALTGLANGFFGGGGGMILIPLLVHLLKRETQKAHATAIMIILPISVVSGIIYILNGSLSWKLCISSGIGVLLGGLAGALLLNKLSSKIIIVIFSLVMIAAGVKLICS